MLRPSFLKDYRENLSKQVALHQDIIDKFKPEKFGFKRAAVLVALFEHDGEVFVILTKRSENLRVHKGHVSLPGGKCDQSDADVIDTALREAEEEIGLHRSNVTVIGISFPFMSPYGIFITPVVGVLKDIKNMTLNVNCIEVDAAFACPLKLFMDASAVTWDNTHSFSYKVPKPKHSYGNKFMQKLAQKSEGREFRIWGVTAHIMVPLVCLFYQQNVFLPPLHYDCNDVFHQTCKHFETNPHFHALFAKIGKL